MQPTTLFQLALAAMVPTMVNAVNNYAATCNSLRFGPPGNNVNSGYYGYNIVANCREPSGVYNVDTFIDLSSCFTNNGGHLAFQINGGFSPSCRSCSFSGTTMTCQCGDGRGGWPTSSIDTNAFIGNLNGVMKC